MGALGLHNAPAALPPAKQGRHPFCWRLGGSQGRSGRVGKISPLPRFDLRTVYPKRVVIPTTISRPTLQHVGKLLCPKCR